MKEARTLNAYRILAMVSQDHEQHAVLSAKLEAGGFTGKGSAINKRLKDRLFGGKRIKSQAEKRDHTIIANVLIGALGTTLTLLLLKKLLDVVTDNPLAPDDKRSSFERARDLVSGNPKGETVTAPEAATATPITQAAISSNNIDVSPLGSEPLVPFKTAQSTQAVRDAIKSASKTEGTDYNLMYAIAGSESSFRTSVSAKTSSAQGLFQFTGPTWDYLMKLYPSLGYSREDRNDPEKASRVASMYVKSIIKTLTRTLGRAPSYGETYMGYFLGPTGGSEFLRELQKNPKAIGAEIFPKAASRNKNVFYKDSNVNAPLTLAQILAKMEGKIVSYALEADPKNKVAASAGSVAAPLVNTASAAPAPAAQAVSANALPAQAPEAKAKAVDGKPVSLPTDAITNKRMLERQAANAPKIDDPAAGSDQKAAQASTSSTKKPDRPTTPIRGRDGRVYKIS